MWIRILFFIFLCQASTLFADTKKQGQNPLEVREGISKQFLLELVSRISSVENQNIQKIDKTLELSRSQREQVRSKFFPRLYSDFQVSAGEQDPGVPLREGYESSFSIGLEYGLDYLGIDQRRLEAANIRLQNQEKLAQSQKDENIKNLVLAFLQWSATCTRLTARQEQLELIRNQYELLRRQFEQGLKTMRDFSRIQSELKRTEMEAFVVKQSLRTDEHRIVKVMGVKLEDISFTCDKSLDFRSAVNMSFSLDEEKDVLPSNPKKVIAKEMIIKAIDEGETQARRLDLEAFNREINWPKVSLFVESGYGATDFVGPTAVTYEDSDYWKWRLGLKLSYTLWDGGLSRSKMDQVKAQSVLQTIKNQESLLESTLGLESNHMELLSAKSELDLRQEIYSFEKKSLELVQSDYKQGRADYLELMDSLQKNIQARIGLGDAAFDYATAKCRVASDMGRLIGYFEPTNFRSNN